MYDTTPALSSPNRLLETKHISLNFVVHREFWQVSWQWKQLNYYFCCTEKLYSAQCSYWLQFHKALTMQALRWRRRNSPQAMAHQKCNCDKHACTWYFPRYSRINFQWWKEHPSKEKKTAPKTKGCGNLAQLELILPKPGSLGSFNHK